ncbi:MAG: class I SAM-dependent methyltransferase, partial [Myxococcota bacterium]
MSNSPTDPQDKPASGRDSHSGFTIRLIACRARALQSILSRGTVLELGCADGLLTRELLKSHNRVIAVEGSKQLAESARQEVSQFSSEIVEIVNTPIETFEPAEGLRFDSVVLACTLEYQDDPSSLLKKCGQWLSERGVVVAIATHSRSVHRLAGVHTGLIDDLDTPEEDGD